MLKSPEVLASEIYAWASKNEILGTVYTIYELHSGEENLDSGTIWTSCMMDFIAVQVFMELIR